MAKPKSKEERAELTVKAYELRKAGASMGVIAQRLNISKATVHKYINDTIKAYLEEAKEAHSSILAMELARLDDMYFSIWTKARSGDAKAIDTALKIMERRARMLGLDVPATSRQVNVTISPDQLAGMTDDELQRIVEQFS